MGISHATIGRLRRAEESNPKVATLLTIQRLAKLPTLDALLGDPAESPSMRIIRGASDGQAV